MVTARRRGGWIGVPPQPATSAQSPPPPPSLVYTIQDRRYQLNGYAYGYASTALPFIPPLDQIYIPPVIARQVQQLLMPGWAASRTGYIDSISQPTAPIIIVRGESARPHPGFVWSRLGPCSIPPTQPAAIEPVIARDIFRMPHPGFAFSLIGSGDLNPIRPQPITIVRAQDNRPLFHGTARGFAQYTDTILQTPLPVIARQSYTPIYPGWWYADSAPIDNGSHLLPAIVVRESTRPYPAGSTFNWHGPSDDGLRPVWPVVARAQDIFFRLATSRFGQSFAFSITPIPPPPPPSPAQICNFSADLENVEAFAFDFNC